MSRWLWLAPFLGWLILGGCSSTSSDDASKAGEATTVVSSSKSVSACPDFTTSGTMYHAQIGVPVVVTLSSTTITQSCHCEYMSDGTSYACNWQKQCASEYDLGGPNPQVCDVIDSVPASLGEVTATTSRADCAATVTVIDASTKSVSVTCAYRGQANIEIVAAGLVNAISLPVFFSEDGTFCPPSYPVEDAGFGDAGVDDDAQTDPGAAGTD